jgi:sulfite reductase (ferredoxin)
MKTSNPLWKEHLGERIPEALAREIDIFETELELRKQGKLDERLFAETRLRRSATTTASGSTVRRCSDSPTLPAN